MSIHESSIITFSSTERLKHLSNTSPCNYSPSHRLLCILCNITTSSRAFSTSLLPFSPTKSRIDGSTTQLRPLQRLTLTASRSSLNASCLFSATCATYVTMSPCSGSSPVATSLLRSSLRLASCLCALTRTNARQTHMWNLRQTAGSACSM